MVLLVDVFAVKLIVEGSAIGVVMTVAVSAMALVDAAGKVAWLFRWRGCLIGGWFPVISLFLDRDPPFFWEI